MSSVWLTEYTYIHKLTSKFIVVTTRQHLVRVILGVEFHSQHELQREHPAGTSLVLLQNLKVTDEIAMLTGIMW